MAKKKTLQAAFEAYDATIRLPRLDGTDSDESRARLIEVRDQLIATIREGLTLKYKDQPSLKPTFDWANQGSYALGTGIRPTGDRHYDIDVALLVNVSHLDERWTDPTKLKQEFIDALTLAGTTSSEPGFMRPCIRVDFPGDNIHVDLAIYATLEGTYLAKGYRGSAADNKVWVKSDPLGLVSHLEGKSFTDTGRIQYRRMIRLWKRWKDEKFRDRGQSAPPGIGLTVLAHGLFVENKHNLTGVPDDLACLAGVVDAALSKFTTQFDTESNSWVHRLVAHLPVEPRTDIFERMSNRQMEAFYIKLTEMRDALRSAQACTDQAERADVLRNKVFPEFPEVESNAAPQRRAVIGTSEAG